MEEEDGTTRHEARHDVAQGLSMQSKEGKWVEEAGVEEEGHELPREGARVSQQAGWPVQ